MGIPREELIEHLREQMYFLGSSAAAFDAGATLEAKRLAVALRVVLHDTTNSRSVLGQLCDVASLQFPCVNQSPASAAPGTAFSFGGMYYFAGDRLIAKTAMSGRTVGFSDWWNETCNFTQSISISRRLAVLALANKGGGAHVDPRARNDYRRIAELHELGWTLVEGSDESSTKDTPLNNPLPQIVRAASAEVLELLSDLPL